MRRHVEIELGGRPHRLVPSPAVLLDIVEKIGDPMQMIVDMRLATRVPRTERVMGVLRIALQHETPGMSDEEANTLLFEAGIGNLYPAYGEFVGALVNGGTVPEGGSGNRAERRAVKAASRSTGKKSSQGSGA
jgi:hypothetical protein